MGSGLAASSSSKYQAVFDRFKAWLPPKVTPNIFTPGAVSDFAVSLYLADELQASQEANIGPQRVITAISAITHFFRLANLPSPASGPLSQALRSAAERLLSSKRLNREGLYKADIIRMLDFHLSSSSDLRTRMHLTTLVLMFVGCMRFSDVREVLVHEDMLQFVPVSADDPTVDGMLLFIPKSKTDQAWKGPWVPIGATHGKYCPVKLVQDLLTQGKYVTSHSSLDCGPLLRAVRWFPSQKTHTLAQVTSPMDTPIPALSDAALRLNIQALALQAGVDKSIGLHSGRIGMVSEAATMPNIEARLVLQLGRWKAQNTMDHTYARILPCEPQKFFNLTRELWSP